MTATIEHEAPVAPLPKPKRQPAGKYVCMRLNKEEEKEFYRILSFFKVEKGQQSAWMKDRIGIRVE